MSSSQYGASLPVKRTGGESVQFWALGGRGDGMDDVSQWVVAMLLAGLTSYFTAREKTKADVARVTERESNHFEQLKELIELVRDDVKDIRNQQRKADD